MKLIRATGMNGSYATFDIEGGDSMYNLGDQIWFNPDGTKLEVYEGLDEDDLKELAQLFDKPKAFLGTFHRTVE